MNSVKILLQLHAPYAVSRDDPHVHMYDDKHKARGAVDKVVASEPFSEAFILL
jgi:hypothetical protein